MRIYITKFCKPCKDGLKPAVSKTGFGTDLSLPLHMSFVELVDLIHDIYEKISAKTLYSSVFKEIKFTITIKY